MMAHRVSLLVVPAEKGGGDSSTARRDLLSRVTTRPDLFAVLYSKGGEMVLAPAFSDYFPRVYNKPATEE
jgi:hypothetical protein